MNISNETLKLLENAIIHSPNYFHTHHWCDYERWVDFVIGSYKNEEYIESWDLYGYLVVNNLQDEVAEKMIKDYQVILNFISYIDRIRNSAVIPDNVKWLIEKLNS